MVRHTMTLQDPGKIITWVGGLPSIIMALAAFAVSPYTVTKLGQTLSGFRDKLKRGEKTEQDQPQAQSSQPKRHF